MYGRWTTCWLHEAWELPRDVTIDQQTNILEMDITLWVVSSYALLISLVFTHIYGFQSRVYNKQSFYIILAVLAPLARLYKSSGICDHRQQPNIANSDPYNSAKFCKICSMLLSCLNMVSRIFNFPTHFFTQKKNDILANNSGVWHRT